MLRTCTATGQVDLATPLDFEGGRYRNRVLLAPMSGITDVPFRRLAWEFGAGMVVSEMVASQAFVTGHEEMRLKAEAAGLPIHVVQLAGREPRWMAEAVRVAEGAGAHVVDINMGCPARKVTTGLSGSALMRDLDHALRLIDATVAATDLPVTLKMRLGWDHGSINAPELAARAEAAGVRLLTVHGRTRCQFYKGQADWSLVRAVREATRLPLVVNGDISDEADAHAALRASGANAVMTGRAAYGAPWLPGAVAGRVDPPADIAGLVLRHHADILSFHGIEVGLRVARKHLGWYLDRVNVRDPARLRGDLMRAADPARAERAIRSAFAEASWRGASEPNALAA